MWQNSAIQTLVCPCFPFHPSRCCFDQHILYVSIIYQLTPLLFSQWGRKPAWGKWFKKTHACVCVCFNVDVWQPRDYISFRLVIKKTLRLSFTLILVQFIKGDRMCQQPSVIQGGKVRYSSNLSCALPSWMSFKMRFAFSNDLSLHLAQKMPQSWKSLMSDIFKV